MTAMRAAGGVGLLVALAGVACEEPKSVGDPRLEDAACEELCDMIVPCVDGATRQQCLGECQLGHIEAHDVGEACATAAAAVNHCILELDGCGPYLDYLNEEPAGGYPCRGTWLEFCDACGVEPGRCELKDGTGTGAGTETG